MLRKQAKPRPADGPRRALLFAALGDETRLALVAQLGAGQPASITRLAAGSRLTRQAITKHLRVLEQAGFVRCRREGRESLFALDTRPIEQMQDYLGFVSSSGMRHWAGSKRLLKTEDRFCSMQ